MAEFDDSSDERLQHEAEELMRQKRFLDAARRYQDLRTTQPTDLWASLGHCSALECAGRIGEAEQVLEEITLRHRRSAPLHRFRRLFFERREDLPNAQVSTAALESDILDDGPDDQLADLYFNQGRYLEARDELGRLLRSDRIENDEMRASVLARLGACLRQIGEMDEARRHLRQSLALEEGHHWTLSELAEVERAQGDVDAARAHYLEALKQAPDDHWCRGHLAQLEAEYGNRERAEELYREILTAEPETVWALVELAQLLAERDGAESRALAERALAADRTYPWAHAHLGQLARRAGDLPGAVLHYQDALDGAPDAPWLLHELAECHRILGRFDEAHRLLDRARDQDPYEASTYGYLADLLRAEGRIPETLAHLEKAVELDPEYTWAWRELAELRALREEHDAADAAYRHAVDLEGDEAVNDGLRAFMLRCRGRRAAAQPWLERAVEKQSDYLWAWRELADLHLAQGDPAAAEQAAAGGLAHIADNPPLLGLRAEALRRLGRHSDALPLVERALERAEDVPQLHALKAEILAETGRLDAALPCAERACALDQSPEYRALLAQILLSDDEIDRANTLVRDLVSGDKPIQPAFELAAVLAERADDHAEALRWCERGLAIYPDDPRLITRRAKLAVTLDRPELVAPLVALVESGANLPWRDAAQVLAQAGETALAHRAAHHVLAASDGEDDERRAKAWLLLAEVDLALGRAEDSAAAADRAVALDGDCVPARILAAVLAERRGALAMAIDHLEHLDRRLHASDNEDTGESGLLLRQLAGLYERAGRHDDAATCWRRIRDDAGADDVAAAVEEASFALRVRRPDADGQAAQLGTHVRGELRERLLRERAVARARYDGPEAALAILRPERDALSSDGLHLLAQLALAAGDPRLALATCDRLGDGSDRQAARLLRVRVLLALRRLDEALALAQSCRQAAASDEATTLVAEALALLGRTEEALAEASAPGHTATGERGLLLALLTLERDGEVPFLAALGRLATPPSHHPLARVFAQAWPGAWGPTSLADSVSADDVLALPPLPIAAGATARALAQRGHPATAAHLALSVAAAILSERPTPARALRIAAIGYLRRAGEWRAALRLAWALGAPWRLFR